MHVAVFLPFFRALIARVVFAGLLSLVQAQDVLAVESRLYLFEKPGNQASILRVIDPAAAKKISIKAGSLVFRDPNPALLASDDHPKLGRLVAEPEAKNKEIGPHSVLRLQAMLIVADRKKPSLPFQPLEAANPLDLLPQSEEIQAPFMHQWDE